MLTRILRNEKGFTLLELIIVITLLGILAGVSVQVFKGRGESTRITAHKSNIAILESTADVYDNEVGITATEFGAIDDGVQGALSTTILTKSNRIKAGSITNPWAATTATQAAYSYQLGVHNGVNAVRLATAGAANADGTWNTGAAVFYVNKSGTVVLVP